MKKNRSFFKFLVMLCFLVLFGPIVSKGNETSSNTQNPDLENLENIIFELDIEATFEFFDHRPQLKSKKSIATKVSVPLNGKAVISQWDSEVTLNENQKLIVKSDISIQLNSFRNGVVFTELRLRELSQGTSSEKLKMHIASPIDRKETTTLNTGEVGSAGSISNCTVSVTPRVLSEHTRAKNKPKY